ncbi:hypothetical protein [Brunnivagina elsteri]|uniref:Uncharacterized protein n=1 Tax=Brunnivagina elsteri CCALA 953 TaxID=987040 RepID=A0A2A2TJP3_9CYAN|nr:hypothetical protein [Calothrix elsteri]PAX55172.1 hypothetical protein CK510_11470 [Calothrix elsteri CCALA 953]
MSEFELHSYLPRLPEEALKEFTEWCVIEQATEAGFELIVDESKLANLTPAYYIEELVDQFVQATRNSIAGGMAILAAGKQADTNALTGIPIVVDFISLYVKYLVPKGEKNILPIDEKLTQAAQEQFDKLCEIAQKHDVDLKA